MVAATSVSAELRSRGRARRLNLGRETCELGRVVWDDRVAHVNAHGGTW